MRNVIYSLMVSLDGFMESTTQQLDWVIVDDELHTFINDQQREVDTYLYGRRMYELMAAHWPTAHEQPSAPAFEVDFGRIWTAMPKVVFSTTLEEVSWNSTLRRGDLALEVATMKAQQGKDIAVGGAEIAGSLLRLGLIDEVRLFLQPVILGAGTWMFPQLDQRQHFALIESRRFDSGVMYLRYQR